MNTLKSHFLFFLCAVLLLAACNKEKHYSKKLMKGETWEVKNITIDGTSSTFFGNWHISTDVNIYDSVPRLEWKFNDEDAVCEWQFQNKGKNFVLNYYQLCEECNGTDLDSLDYLSHNLSGNYTVIKHGRKQMEFESSATKAFAGKKVIISIERK